MKFLSACTLLILFSTSCKKEYSCVCSHPGGDEVVFTVKDNEGDAKKKCDDYYNENFANVPLNETTCAIK